MSELRQDPVSGDWVVIAAGRADRPFMLGKKISRAAAPRKGCPFERLEKSGNWPPLALYPNTKQWRLAIIPNKYPALEHDEKGTHAHAFQRGLYHGASGVGECELAVTRDHDRSFTKLSPDEVRELFDAFVDRHRAAAKDDCLVYVTTFLNWGASVGGSLWHPHYQIIALPLIPPHARHSLEGAERYFKKHRTCVRCDIVKAERKARTRVIAENDSAIAMAPFASKRAFEVSVLPKKHYASFHETPKKVVYDVGMLVQEVAKKMKSRVNDPDLNFFIHDAPLEGKEYKHHHWHVELMPNISLLGGLEFSTGIYVNTVDPDKAAAVLRGN